MVIAPHFNMENDFQPPWPRLPWECCILIVDCLRHDLFSLVSLLKVSKATFALAAPRLYQDPFALINERFSSNDEREKRYAKLFVTLFHGILEPYIPSSGNFETGAPATVSRAMADLDLSHAPNRYIEYYTHVDLTLMFGDKKSVFRKVFKPRPDNIGLPLLGVKTLLKYQADRILFLRLPLRTLKTFRPYQQTPTFPDLQLFSALHSLRHLEVVDSPLSGSSAGGVEKQLLLWHGLRDGLALRREDLGEDCWLDTIKFLTDYTVVKHGPGDVVRAAHPGLHSLVVQVITDIPHLLSSFTDATAHALRKLSFVMDSTPLVELLPLLQRFRQLEELSIHTVPDDRHDDTFGLKSLDSEPEASDSATPMGATLPIKRLRVLSSDENSAFHSWLRVAIALCADTLEDLVVLELPHDVGDTERLEHPTWLSSNVSAEALWLNCKLPKLARLTFVSYDISYPFMYPPFNVRPAGADTGHHPTVGAENSSSTSSTSQEIMNPVVDMFPSLTSLSIIRCENQDRARFSSTAWKSLEPALGALRKLTTLRDLLVDLASLAQFHTLRPQEVLDCLPKGLRSFDFAASSPSSWSRMATEFEEGLRRAFLERQHDPLDVLVDSADDTHADSVQRTIPKIRTIAWPGLRTALLKDAFWLNHDIRNRFYR